MRILLVRHALALRRRDWTRADLLRPLAPKGFFQADELVAQLKPFGVDRILCSPYVRCVETVTPLSQALNLTIEPAQSLAEGETTAALKLVGARKEKCVVLCSHGDVIPQLLDELAGTSSLEDGLEFAKGSTWVVEPNTEPQYLPPPRARRR